MGFSQSKPTEEKPALTLEELEAIMQTDAYCASDELKLRYLALQSKVDPGHYEEYGA
jgi:hypothetical protein